MWPYVDGSILVAVPGGPFTMGHGGSDNPEHTVTLSDFWIYQAKVTNQQYALCLQAGKCKAPDPIDDFTFKDATHANDPVVGLNYSQGSDYCSFVHGRLPTEAEWEKTARGPQGNLYPWGSNAPVCDLLNLTTASKRSPMSPPIRRAKVIITPSIWKATSSSGWGIGTTPSTTRTAPRRIPSDRMPVSSDRFAPPATRASQTRYPLRPVAMIFPTTTAATWASAASSKTPPTSPPPASPSASWASRLRAGPPAAHSRRIVLKSASA